MSDLDVWLKWFRSKGEYYAEKLKKALRDPESRKKILIAAAVLVLGATTTARRTRNRGHRSATKAPLSLLIQALEERSTSHIFMGNNEIYFKVNHYWKRANLPRNDNFQQNLLQQILQTQGTRVEALPESVLSQLSTPLITLMPFLYLYFVYKMLKGGDHMNTPDTENTKTTLVDVAGMDGIKFECEEIINYLKNPTEYTRLGARAPRGLLLHGPPGSGKTLLARALAGEAAVDAFVACSASAFVEMYVGRGAARVRNIFEKVKQKARRKDWWAYLTGQTRAHTTAILFIDELDALAKVRSGSAFVSNDEREQTLNQLLSEMDGFTQDDGVTLVVIAATNRVDVLDPAILRRFERQIHVSYPDEQGRKEVLQIHSKNIKHDANIDWDKVAIGTHDFSGADLRNVINESALLAVRAGYQTVKQDNIDHAVRRIRANKEGVGLTDGLMNVFAMD